MTASNVIEGTFVLSLLKQHFGFSSFRHLQREIIMDILNKRDVLALLPTGGGKSVCFQLPAMAQPGLTLVISPLIALMKDQVQLLKTTRIPATYINSGIPQEECQRRWREVAQGKVRLLYLAPERAIMPSVLAELAHCQITLIAIDEAHCISEWGHDFRPDYRQLSTLRERFPNVPVLALTATATPRVRMDIVDLLQLRDPGIYVASFDRPNLKYEVARLVDADSQLKSFLKQHDGQSGIVYCQTRKSAELLAARLREGGVACMAYHAGMDTAERTRSHDLFVSGHIKVMCATVAFGMGIHKPDIRFVVHYGLPKNLESYYQETGRAGRDGKPSDCLLLFQTADYLKQQRFIDSKPADQREGARDQLRRIFDFARTPNCRRAFLLRYFGEDPKSEKCDGCDNCARHAASVDATVPAQKFLSCIVRVEEKNGFGVGLSHIIDVILGRQTERVQKWEHQGLSTFGVGKELSKAAWIALGEELIRQGLIAERSDKFHVLEVTERGRKALAARERILASPAFHELAKQVEVVGTSQLSDSGFESVQLFRQGRSIEQIAAQRHLKPSTIYGHLALGFATGMLTAIDRLVNEEQQQEIAQALREHGHSKLGLVREHLQRRYDYGLLECVSAFMQRSGKSDARKEATQAFGRV